MQHDASRCTSTCSMMRHEHNIYIMFAYLVISTATSKASWRTLTCVCVMMRRVLMHIDVRCVIALVLTTKNKDQSTTYTTQIYDFWPGNRVGHILTTLEPLATNSTASVWISPVCYRVNNQFQTPVILQFYYHNTDLLVTFCCSMHSQQTVGTNVVNNCGNKTSMLDILNL